MQCKKTIWLTIGFRLPWIHERQQPRNVLLNYFYGNINESFGVPEYAV
jgi:hypothetical protein